MSISNALHFAPAGRNHQGFQAPSFPSLSTRQEYTLLMSAMAIFLAGSTGVVLFALSALGH